jgi:hypothetical protein
MEPGDLIASRYRVLEPLEAEGNPPSFLGNDLDTKADVVLFELSGEEARALRPLAGIEHAHLARVFGVVDLGAGKFALATERVVGPTLGAVLAEVERETPVEAVRSTLRVADAVSVVHQAGGAHGFISPSSLVVAPEGHAPPRLAFAPAGGSSPYRSPKRGEDGPPSVADDAWATTGLLYEMLIGKPPPADGIASVEALEREGITDPALRDTLLHGLNADESQRAQDTTALRRELARWFVDKATTEAAANPQHSSNPPPLPSSPPGGLAAGVSARPRSRLLRTRGLIFVLAGAAILIGLGASWAFRAGTRKSKVLQVPVPPPSAAGPSAAASASGKSIDLSEVPVTGDKEAATGNKMATCVSAYLPKGTFIDTTPDFAWICAQPDPREGGTKLRATVIVSRPKDRVTEALKIFGRLGWYEMAAYAVVYRGCCGDAPALSLPEPAPGCPKLDAALNTVGRDAVGGGSVDDALKALAAAIECEVKANHAGVYRHPGKPGAGEEDAFRDLLKLTQSP